MSLRIRALKNAKFVKNGTNLPVIFIFAFENIENLP